MKLLISIIFGCFLATKASIFQIDPDETRSFPELIQSRGFNLQTYKVTTKDGYILTVHRVVPLDYNSSYSKTRKPVIAFHGLMAQSSIFYLNSPFLESNDSKCGDTFGFGMVRLGKYDLWVPNARGNGLGNEHVNMSTLNPNFWKFTYEEIGLYDIPAILDLVRNKTGHKTVGYVGWSQGGQSLFSLLSLKPQYANYIRPFIGWGSTSYMKHFRSPVLSVAQLVRPIFELIPAEFIFTEKWLNNLLPAICRPGMLASLCNTFGFESNMGQSNSINLTRVPVYTKFFPNPVSTWQLAHTMQNAKTGRYARFDHFFKSRNIAKYGQLTPPEYPLENIPANFTAFFIFGATDAYMTSEDQWYFINKLKGYGINADGYLVPKDLWSHFDYLTGMGAGKLMYDKTIEILDKYVIQDGPK